MPNEADGFETERSLDRAVIESLAHEYDRPDAEVERILREEVEHLSAEARIGTFVPVIAARRARDRLESGRSGDR